MSEQPEDPKEEPTSPVPPNNRILSRNRNGTFAMTAQPTNDAEFQLYRVLQRANLLSYFDTFISHGGDDVQQLCEAGQEEFLEIMSLVGMATKPLHVRRLQKTLRDWTCNQELFQPPVFSSLPPAGPFGMGLTPRGALMMASGASHSLTSPSALSSLLPSGSNNALTTMQDRCPSTVPSGNGSVRQSPSPGLSNKDSSSIPSPSQQSTAGIDSYGNPGSPVHLTPVLMDSQIQKLAEAAELLAQSLPQCEPRPQNSKKRISKELELVMSMTREDPKRMEELRKYAAIYGRFDCKRKPEKPLTLHEVSVNEAAAQICRHIPALLTRRDELFPLARQVVRDSGYQYSKGHSKFELNTKPGRLCNGGSDETSNKRQRLENDELQRDMQWCKRQERLEQITEELTILADKGEELRNKYSQTDSLSLPALQQQMDSIQLRQQQLILEKNELLKHQKRAVQRLGKNSEYDRVDTDDADSQFSLSETSSPQGQDPGENSGDSGSRKIPKQLLQEALMDEGLRVVKEMVGYSKDPLSPSQPTSSFSPYPRVIATSGSSVIAVANPALAMSPYEAQDRSQHSSISALMNLSQSVGHDVQVKSEPQQEVKQETCAIPTSREDSL